MPECSSGHGPHVVVLSSLFPSARQPGAGLFIRERMFRVGRQLPLSVVSPVPWFPLQGLLRRFRPNFRAGAPDYEVQDGFDVWFPRFFSVPGSFKQFDGWLMAIGAYLRLRRLRKAGRLDLIDAHFAYPDGYAAVLLGRWLGVPATITLRGTEVRHAQDRRLVAKLTRALNGAVRVFAVSQSLRLLALGLGVPAEKVLVVGNGVDLERFSPMARELARHALGLPAVVPVLVTVGALVERKGFHRVIELLPALRERFPGLLYLAVGGPSPEGDISASLRKQVQDMGLNDAVRFLGPLAPEELRVPLSAANVFVLPTRNEGWANVLLEAMACGLPVVATDVGGNAEVVSSPALGQVVPFGNAEALQHAIEASVAQSWDVEAIREHARQNTWDQRVELLLRELKANCPDGLSNGAVHAKAGHA